MTGKTPPSSVEGSFGGPTPFVTPSDYDGSKYIRQTARSLTSVGANAIRSGRIPSGAVMVTCIGSDMGKVALNVSEAFTNQQINSLIVEDDTTAEYVYYNLLMRKAELRARASGSAQPILNKTAFGAVELELPGIEEQAAVVDILSNIDHRIELLHQTNTTLESIAQALFKSWFIDFDPVRAKAEGREPEGMDAATAALFPDSFEDSAFGEIPKGWRVGSVRDVCTIFDSKRVPLSGKERAGRKGPYPYYGAASLMDLVDDFLFDGVYLLLGEDGSVVNADGTPVRQYVWGKFWVNNHAHVLQGTNGICTEHLMLGVQGVDFTPYVTGAVQPKLNQANLFRVPFLIPTAEVAAAFASEVEPLYAKLRGNAAQAQTLTELRNALLPRFISGRLSLPDVIEQAVEVTV
ncbi:restriction endonuclease subunit S [Burkholderia pseudomallei]|nr:restriction endonuclease subunit S [Burkholderia pseudomallei]